MWRVGVRNLRGGGRGHRDSPNRRRDPIHQLQFRKWLRSTRNTKSQTETQIRGIRYRARPRTPDFQLDLSPKAATLNHLDPILSGVHALKPLPAVCTRVMQLAGEENIVPGELVAVIQTDAGITAKVLRLCNSAYYGFARQVDSLDEAGNRLGVNTLVNLVLTACSGNYFKSLGNADEAHAKQHWERSISNALAASLLAKIQDDVNPSSAYTVGLLQDIGEIIIDRFAPEEGALIRKEVLHGRNRIEAEFNLLEWTTRKSAQSWQPSGNSLMRSLMRSVSTTIPLPPRLPQKWPARPASRTR